MHSLRKKRLIWIAIILLLAGSAVGLSLFALKQNIDLFFTPKQIMAGAAPRQQEIRVGGWVVPGSIQHNKNTLLISFKITDHVKTLEVHYQGILPDLFREGQAVVVEGMLDSTNKLIATQVLAKHDENYTPPQIK